MEGRRKEMKEGRKEGRKEGKENKKERKKKDGWEVKRGKTKM